MKKIIYAVLVIGLLTLIPLTGCGGADNTEDIKAAADGFMSAMQAGDIEKAKEYADPALFEENGSLNSFAKLENIDEEFASAMGMDADQLSDTAKTSVQGFVDNLLKNMIKSYEIGDVTEEEGVGKVNVSTTFGFDPDKMQDVDINGEIEEMATKYMTDNMTELMEIYNNDGQQAMMKKVIDDLLDDILDKYTDAVMATGEVSQDSVMTVENKDGKWLVTEEKVTE